MMRLAVLLLAFAAAATAAVEMRPDSRAIAEAIAIGQSRIERERVRFHAPYRLAVNRPPVDYVEVITPFRRVVLAAESRAQVGDRSFGQRLALEVLDAAPAAVELWTEFTFHPLNTYVGVPAYDVALVGPRGERIPPGNVERRPRHGPRLEGMPLPLPVPGGLVMPKESQPLLGGTVVTQFDGRLLNPAAVYDVVIEESGKELARARADLARLR